MHSLILTAWGVAGGVGGQYVGASRPSSAKRPASAPAPAPAAKRQATKQEELEEDMDVLRVGPRMRDVWLRPACYGAALHICAPFASCACNAPQSTVTPNDL